MRHIDYNPDTLAIPANWPNNAAVLSAQMLAEADPQLRAKIINDNSNIWSEVKGELAKVFNYKCWYTESRQLGTDVDVDHYRPKNRVAELRANNPQHFGYWWLAFDLRNYRYSCIVANRRRRDIESDLVGGKSDYFPLWDEATRVWDQTGDIDEEQPMLLDPCKVADVRLLTFKEDGEAMPREDEKAKPRMFKRADMSIKFYSLNHSDFVRARIALRDEMTKLVKDAIKYYKKLESGDATLDHAYEQAIQKLRSLTSYHAEFSSFCIAYLENFKHEEALAGAFI